MLYPWLDLTRATSSKSPNQPTDWLTTFDADGTQRDCIDVYCGSLIKSASDPRVSPLFRKPSSRLPKQFLSAGQAEVLFADARLWAEKCRSESGDEAIEHHFAQDQVHTFAIGGWLADAGVESVSDQRLSTFVKRQIEQ
jgi:acetyl esterase/lipase